MFTINYALSPQISCYLNNQVIITFIFTRHRGLSIELYSGAQIFLEISQNRNFNKQSSITALLFDKLSCSSFRIFCGSEEKNNSPVNFPFHFKTVITFIQFSAIKNNIQHDCESRILGELVNKFSSRQMFSNYTLTKTNKNLLKFNNTNTRQGCEICSKWSVKKSEWHWRSSGAFILNLELISQLFLLFVELLWKVKLGCVGLAGVCAKLINAMILFEGNSLILSAISGQCIILYPLKTWENQRISGKFRMFPGGIIWEYWPEMC